jgi:hypothetical protein
MLSFVIIIGYADVDKVTFGSKTVKNQFMRVLFKKITFDGEWFSGRRVVEER